MFLHPDDTKLYHRGCRGGKGKSNGISIPVKDAYGGLRYYVGGDRPSQTG